MVFAFVFVRFLKIWIFELRFYHAVNWDFSVDSKYSGSAKLGDIVLAGDKGIPMSNRARVLMLTPLIIVGAALAVVMSVFFVL